MNRSVIMTVASTANCTKVRSIWLCLDRNTVYGNRKETYATDLMRGIIISVRNGKNTKESQNALISMLEKLLSKSGLEEKKRMLAEEYEMVMTTELEGRVQTMCNWSEAIKEIMHERMRHCNRRTQKTRLAGNTGFSLPDASGIWQTNGNTRRA